MVEKEKKRTLVFLRNTQHKTAATAVIKNWIRIQNFIQASMAYHPHPICIGIISSLGIGFTSFNKHWMCTGKTYL